MTSRGGPPDDVPDGMPAEKPDAGGSSSSLTENAQTWVLETEHYESNPLFEGIVRAVEGQFNQKALRYAEGMVGRSDAEDAVNTAWLKALPAFDASNGRFESLFRRTLHNACVDILRKRNRQQPVPADDLAFVELLRGSAAPGAAAVESSVEEASMRDKIVTAIEVLDLTATQRSMLRRLVDLLETGQRSDASPESLRQQKARTVAKVKCLAGLTTQEEGAVRLVRKCQGVVADAAAIAPPGLDVRGQYQSAQRKVLALFGLDAGDF